MRQRDRGKDSHGKIETCVVRDGRLKLARLPWTPGSYNVLLRESTSSPQMFNLTARPLSKGGRQKGSWGLAQSRTVCLCSIHGKTQLWDFLRGADGEAKHQTCHTGKLPFRYSRSHFPKTCLSSSQNKTMKRQDTQWFLKMNQKPCKSSMYL